MWASDVTTDANEKPAGDIAASETKADSALAGPSQDVRSPEPLNTSVSADAVVVAPDAPKAESEAAAAVPAQSIETQPTTTKRAWTQWLTYGSLGLVLVAGVALAAYLFLYGPDQTWENCKTLEMRTPEQRIQDCGAVIVSGGQPSNAMALAMRIRARAFFDVGEIASAVQDYSQALKHIADDPTLFSERGFAYLRNGQPAKAIEDFTAATQLDASLVEPLVGRGNAYLALGQPQQAAQDFSVALTLKPDLSEAVYRRALANVRLSQIADAAADYDRALELSPKNPSYWNARCWFRATMSIDLDLALADCDTALKLKPKFAPAMDSRAFVLLRLSRIEEALLAYDKAIAAEPRYAWPYFGRGIVKKRLGDEAGAQADFAAARERQPDIDQQYANYGETP